MTREVLEKIAKLGDDGDDAYSDVYEALGFKLGCDDEPYAEIPLFKGSLFSLLASGKGLCGDGPHTISLRFHYRSAGRMGNISHNYTMKDNPTIGFVKRLVDLLIERE